MTLTEMSDHELNPKSMRNKVHYRILLGKPAKSENKTIN